MTDFARNTKTTATATGFQRRWAGEAKPQTVARWMKSNGLEVCSVSVDTIEKARAVHIEHYRLNQDGSRA